MSHRKPVAQVMHEAHLAYQRQQLRKDDLPDDGRAACPEQRGCHFKLTLTQAQQARVAFNPAWFTHLRDNFWRGFAETTIDVQRTIASRKRKRP